MQPRRVAMVTLGCEKNAVDSEVMAGLMEKKGYTVTDNPEDADVIIVNTCGFIDAAKQESVEAVLRMAGVKEKGKQTLMVTGCLVQRYAEELAREIPEIDGLIGTGDFHRVTEAVELAQRGEKAWFVGNPVYIYDEFTPRLQTDSGSSAYVKIAEGCDHACTFCVIPLMRGKFRSRTIESVAAEARRLVSRGVKEINLIAQDSTQYGLDVYGRRRLPDLLRELNEIEDLEWIRLHYAYPGFFGDDLIAAFRDLPKVVKYVDMPLQHSEDRILRAMRRPGSQSRIRELIAKIRENIPGVALRSSFIVGFPGETEEEFARLKEFVREIGFERVGVFTYSQEDSAPSADFPHQVSEAVKERRASELMETAREVAALRLQRHVGEVLPVLIESAAQDGGYVGRTPFDAREIDGSVFVSGAAVEVGTIVPVRISHSFEFDLAGEVV